jgi:hypothetical protein
MPVLKPCPFCGGKTTEIRESSYWTGMRSELLTVTVIHWCEPGRGSIIKITEATEELAVARWNDRK